MGVKIKHWKGAWWLFVNNQGRRKAKRVGVGNAGKKAAKEVATKLAARLALGEFKMDDAPVPTFQVYAERWLQHRALDLKPRTLELYGSILKHHLLPAFGKLPLPQVSRERVRDLLMAKSEAGLKRTTVYQLWSCLRTLLNAAVEDGLLPNNSAAKLGKRLGRLGSKREGEVEIFTEQELAHLLTTAEREFPEAADLLFVMAWTGCREGEAFGLRREDLDLYGRFLEIRRTVGYRQGQLQTGTPKSNKSRRVDLPEALVRRLQARLELAKAHATFEGKEPVSWVFPNRAGKPLDAKNFQVRIWRPLLTKAGLSYRPPHTLRHTYCSLLLMRGESPAYVQAQAGHSSVQVTIDLYSHWIPGVGRGAVERLAEATGRNLYATKQQEESTPHALAPR